MSNNKPIVLKLEPNKNYAWCSCGLSEILPICDGSHVGTEFSPVIFSVEKAKKVSICNCRHTKNPPFCDGIHKQKGKS